MARNTRLFLAVLVLIPALAVMAGAFEVVTVDGMRMEASVASLSQAPTPYLAIPFGPGEAQVGGAEQDPDHATEGIPFAFLPMADGSVWVLDSVNKLLKRFSPDGKVMAKVSLTTVAGKGELGIRDFSPAPADGFYFLSSSDWKTIRTDQAGKPLSELEGVTDARSLGRDPQGNLLINIPAMQGLLRFTPAGEIIEKFDYPTADQFEAAVFTDLEGRPYFVKGSDQAMELGKFTAASPTKELILASFPLDVPSDRKAHYVSGKVLGVDASAHIYVELVACDDDGVIHRHRIFRLTPDGKTTGQADIRVIPYLSPDLPRHAAVMPDGRILGFMLQGSSYVLCTWTVK